MPGDIPRRATPAGRCSYSHDVEVGPHVVVGHATDDRGRTGTRSLKAKFLWPEGQTDVIVDF